MTGRPPNRLRGEFEAVLDGEPRGFDTALGTVALIEERCGDVSIVEAINTAVFGRRARERLALVAGALAAMGYPEPEALAARATSVEAEAFILALMEALGFEVVAKAEGGAGGPFGTRPEETDGSSGGAGAASRSGS